MDFSTKCDVLGDLWAYYREDIQSSEAWLEFFMYNDVALPLAYCIDRGYVVMAEDSEAYSFVDETWEMFCEYINIPVDGEYANLTAAFAASDQPPLNPSEA